MINITLRQLSVFVAIARRGNLTAAAESVYLTQSAASMSLRELERCLQGPLFHRVGRRLVLNDRGRAVLPRAEAVLAGVGEIAEATCNAPGPPTGTLVVGCSTTIATYELPDRIKALHDVHPGVEVVLRVGNTREMADCLRAGEIDFGLVEGEIVQKDLDEEDWVRDELVVFGPRSHPLATRRRVGLASLAHEKWIMREQGSGTLSTILAAFAREKVHIERIQEIGHTEAIKRAVEAGMGVSCLSRAAVARELASGRLAELRIPFVIDRWFRIITFPGRYRSPLVSFALEWLRTAGRVPGNGMGRSK